MAWGARNLIPTQALTSLSESVICDNPPRKHFAVAGPLALDAAPRGLLPMFCGRGSASGAPRDVISLSCVLLPSRSDGACGSQLRNAVESLGARTMHRRALRSATALRRFWLGCFGLQTLAQNALSCELPRGSWQRSARPQLFGAFTLKISPWLFAARKTRAPTSLQCNLLSRGTTKLTEFRHSVTCVKRDSFTSKPGNLLSTSDHDHAHSHHHFRRARRRRLVHGRRLRKLRGGRLRQRRLHRDVRQQ